MMTPSATVIAAVLLLLSAATTSAFNITILLGRYPGFEQFNQLLSRHHLAEQINGRKTITVLGLPNDRVSSLMQMTDDVQKSVLSLHVILDYYDMIKFNKISPGSKLVATTLYQATGVANDKQGFIDIVHRKDGSIAFGSSMPNAPLVSMLVNSVAAQPFNISVLSVSQPIIAPGMDGNWIDPAVPVTFPPPPAAPAPVPVAEEPAVEETTSDTPAPAPAPAKSKNKKKPKAEASAPAPAEEEEESPAEDAPADESQDYSGEKAEENYDKKNGAGRGMVSGMVVAVGIGMASVVAGC